MQDLGSFATRLLGLETGRFTYYVLRTSSRFVQNEAMHGEKGA
jgi:hypothetical protein